MTEFGSFVRSSLNRKTCKKKRVRARACAYDEFFTDENNDGIEKDEVYTKSRKKKRKKIRNGGNLNCTVNINN